MIEIKKEFFGYLVILTMNNCKSSKYFKNYNDAIKHRDELLK